ncbi:MAG TPA: ATPase, T2SS/T4P/T4SS family [Acidobacteriota bacterium]|nr:ATPase, T2SS/T4P/T4SS family [Acidobacteriota bacterium]
MARKKIGDLLVERGYITPQQLKESLQAQQTTDKRLGEILVEKQYVTEEQVTECASERLSIPRVSLKMMVIDPNVIQRLPVEVARRYTLIPIFAIGNTLTLAMADPLNILALEEIRYLTGAEIKRAIATTTEIKEAINQYYSVADSLGEIMETESENQNLIGAKAADRDGSTEVETPVMKLVSLIIAKAVRARASDIHVEPDENTVRIRFRINGVMREEASPPKSVQREIISRIKVAANMDVSEQRLPQDGRLMTTVDNLPIDLRVSTLPTIHGEKIVIRILDRRNLSLTFGDLGFNTAITNAWQNVIHKPEGLILISGPTSSGKTSTLYATLRVINSIEKNIITVEDPVEYSLPLINQMQINEKAGLTFPSTLRSILRQNPDIIMIGEIRDAETAQMAIRSALTGHLVFSTIHTNDAPSAITRLIDMGIENYLLASALKGVLAQRLVRVNCPQCLVSYQPSDTLLNRAGIGEISGTVDFRRTNGCTHCKGTGFTGLTGIFEFVNITAQITEMILDNASPARIRETARLQGYTPLFEAGLEKLRDGTLCLEELLKETSNIEDYFHSQRRIAAGEPNARPV